MTALRRRVAALLLAALAAAAAAQPVLRDDRGVEHRFTRVPARIVSLMPSLTETVCVLGACSRLVGTDRFSNWPPAVQALPKLGGLEDPQLERTVALRPDVVLVSRTSRIAERLQALGLEVVALDSDSHDDVRRSLRLLARLLDAGAEGERVLAAVEHEIDAAVARVPARWRGRKVYFEVDSGPYAAGTTSFIGQTLARLGLDNIAPASLGAFPALNPEFIVRSQPDLVVAAKAEAETMISRPGWSGLVALQKGQVCAFDNLQFEVLVRPGPRLGVAAALIADCLASLPAR